jgi:dsDNA-binding SOS-regulon protein
MTDDKFSAMADKLIAFLDENNITMTDEEWEMFGAEAVDMFNAVDKEAYERGFESKKACVQVTDEALKEARTTALEEAAKVAERTDIGVHVDCRRRVSAEIRNLKGEKRQSEDFPRIDCES